MSLSSDRDGGGGNLERQRLFVLFLIALTLLFSPLPVLFERLAPWLGLPPLVLYLFLVWTGVVALTFWILVGTRDR